MSIHIGQPPKRIEQASPGLKLYIDSSISARPPPGKELSKNPKSLLNEFCQSNKFSLPMYQTSEDGFVVTVSIMIEGQEVHYSYTSEQAMSTKKYTKQCEEIVAEKAFTALNNQNGTTVSGVPIQTYDIPSGNIVRCYASCTIATTHMHCTVTDQPSHSEPQKTPSCQGFGKLSLSSIKPFICSCNIMTIYRQSR